jgi:hypothetical protein
MFKKKPPIRFWLILAALCFLLGFSFDFGSSDSGPGLTKSNCDHIQVGMTEKEVEVLLGGPATWVVVEDSDGAVKMWIGRECSATIGFADGRVLWRSFYYEPTLLDRALEKLGLRSKKNP